MHGQSEKTRPGRLEGHHQPHTHGCLNADGQTEQIWIQRECVWTGFSRSLPNNPSVCELRVPKVREHASFFYSLYESSGRTEGDKQRERERKVEGEGEKGGGGRKSEWQRERARESEKEV